MKSLFDIESRRLCPCPLCGEGLEVRKSKKGKPYVVCYGCGLQMFVRGEPGIRRLDGLVESAQAQNSWQRMAELEQRYRMKCPRCGKSFWAGEEVRETGWFESDTGVRNRGATGSLR